MVDVTGEGIPPHRTLNTLAAYGILQQAGLPESKISQVIEKIEASIEDWKRQPTGYERTTVEFERQAKLEAWDEIERLKPLADTSPTLTDTRKWAIETLLSNGSNRNNPKLLMSMAESLAHYVLDGLPKEQQPSTADVREAFKEARADYPESLVDGPPPPKANWNP